MGSDWRGAQAGASLRAMGAVLRLLARPKLRQRRLRLTVVHNMLIFVLAVYKQRQRSTGNRHTSCMCF